MFVLQLKNIKKDYLTGEETVHALKGISIAFRESEFVSILGQSGCGKTTLLNIIGGLDRYTSGDLVINGRSTREYKDRDWDAYRNHSVGFVFQSYNLIPHQNVLSNVELALTLSGVSKGERRRRAREALEKVGLGDQLKKMPNQMSGGQMQRVAIARALVNNPDILLADEPTGALDSETSVQVMEILKEVAKDRLVIMVTHNPDLAERYSTRIVRVLDGNVVSDSMPYEPQKEEIRVEQDKMKKPSMSFFTALSLSLRNLMTKKGRTILTAFAGSIGIIGIALILSLSSGMQSYIDNMEEETLTSYPITIESASVDMSSMMISMMGQNREEHEDGKIYSQNIMTTMINSIMNQISTNDLKYFKSQLETEGNEIAALCADIQYQYGTEIGIYTRNVAGKLQQVNPCTVMSDIGLGDASKMMDKNMFVSTDVVTALVDNKTMREHDYELLEGRWPNAYNEVVITVTEDNCMTDYTLYALGLMNIEELQDAMLEAQQDIMENGTVTKDVDIDKGTAEYTYEDLLGLELKLVLPTDYFEEQEDGTFADMRDDEEYMEQMVDSAESLKVVGIVRSTNGNSNEYGTIGYTSALTEYVIAGIQASAIYRQQEADPDTDIFTGLPFPGTEAAQAIEAEEAAAKTEAAGEAVDEGLTEAQREMLDQTLAAVPAEYGLGDDTEEEQIAALIQYGMLDEALFESLGADTQSEFNEEQTAMLEAAIAALPEEYRGQLEQLPAAAQVEALAENGLIDSDAFYALAGEEIAEETPAKRISDSSYEANMSLIQAASVEEPTSINLYAASFDDKEAITAALDAYNDRQNESGNEDKVIRYTDYVGLLMSSVTSIVNSVSYVLIAFVGISLVVSSIMIGVITLISVQERTKEIGILRAIGASKKDVSRVFNAETLIIGLSAGLFGIGITLLLNIPINIIIEHLTDIKNIAQLPVTGGIILVAISVVLTMIAGLIPAKAAARKDPVEALRTE